MKYLLLPLLDVCMLWFWPGVCQSCLDVFVESCGLHHTGRPTPSFCDRPCVRSFVFQHVDVVRCLIQSRVHEPIKQMMCYAINTARFKVDHIQKLFPIFHVKFCSNLPCFKFNSNMTSRIRYTNKGMFE